MFRIALTTAFLGLSSMASAEMMVTTSTGEVALADVPQTVAAFDVAAVDTLTALGVPPQGTTSNLYVDYLEPATPVGSLFEPDLEALNALQPDLIIVGGRSASKIEDVQRVAPAVDMSIRGDVVAEGLARLDTYGKMFGKEAEAAELRAAFEARQASVQAALSDKGNALIIMTNGPKVSAYGPQGRFGWLHTALGLGAATEIDESNHGEGVSFEFIREVNPDVLLVLDRQAAIGGDEDPAAKVLNNALVQETNAWKNGQVIYLDSAAAYIAAGGIQGLNKVLDSVEAGLSGS